MMEPFLLSFDPATAQGVPITHDGQEFVYVVEGAVELFYDGRCYRLEQGDSAYLDSSRPIPFTAGRLYRAHACGGEFVRGACVAQNMIFLDTVRTSASRIFMTCGRL